ncbi:glycoside hydrolase superfamily [Podospora conica]|nr:glycoside hydrolase superfamily [Schizothecium conicum]
MLSGSFTTLALVGLAAAKVRFLGVSIPSGDSGCTIEGTCQPNSTQLPSLPLGTTNNNNTSEAQMKHFATNDLMNIFRLPIPSQSLVADDSPSAPFLAQYDRLVQSCLATGAHCIIAPQGSPSEELWTALAKSYAASPSIIFELPHPPPPAATTLNTTTPDIDITTLDITTPDTATPDTDTTDTTAPDCPDTTNLDTPTLDTTPLDTAAAQSAVSAIRAAGATAQMILLPGLAFSSPEDVQSTGDGLAKITNPDGGKENLLFALRRYLDEENSGRQGTECATNNNAAFETAAVYLRGVGRQAVVTETGVPGGEDPFCFVWFCEQNRFVNGNADVFAGLVVSAVGDGGLMPGWEGGRWVDAPVVANCVVGTWLASPVVDGGRGIGGVRGAAAGRVGVVWWVVGAGLGVAVVGL